MTKSELQTVRVAYSRLHTIFRDLTAPQPDTKNARMTVAAAMEDLGSLIPRPNNTELPG